MSVLRQRGAKSQSRNTENLNRSENVDELLKQAAQQIAQTSALVRSSLSSNVSKAGTLDDSRISSLSNGTSTSAKSRTPVPLKQSTS